MDIFRGHLQDHLFTFSAKLVTVLISKTLNNNGLYNKGVSGNNTRKNKPDF